MRRWFLIDNVINTDKIWKRCEERCEATFTEKPRDKVLVDMPVLCNFWSEGTLKENSQIEKIFGVSKWQLRKKRLSEASWEYWQKFNNT